MSIRKLSAAEVEALFTDLCNRANCPNGCKCVFCRTFDEGVQSGKHDAAIEFGNALDSFRRGLKA